MWIITTIVPTAETETFRHVCVVKVKNMCTFAQTTATKVTYFLHSLTCLVPDCMQNCLELEYFPCGQQTNSPISFTKCVQNRPMQCYWVVKSNQKYAWCHQTKSCTRSTRLPGTRSMTRRCLEDISVNHFTIWHTYTDLFRKEIFIFEWFRYN